MTLTDAVTKIVDNIAEAKERRLKEYKDDIHKMTNQLQVVLGFMEMGEHDKALLSLHEHILQIRGVATRLAGTPEAVTMLSGIADLDKTVRIVPKNTTVEVVSGDAPKTLIVTHPTTEMHVKASVPVSVKIAAHKKDAGPSKKIKKVAKKPPHSVR